MDDKKRLLIFFGALGLFAGALLLLRAELVLVAFYRLEGFAYYSGTNLEVFGIGYALVAICIALIYIVGILAIIGGVLLGKGKKPRTGALLMIVAGVMSLVGSFTPVINTQYFEISGVTLSYSMVAIETLNFLGPRVIGEPSGLLLIAGVLGLLVKVRQGQTQQQQQNVQGPAATPAPSNKTCPACGMAVPGGQSFCGHCGAKM